MSKRDFNVGIKSEDEFFQGIHEIVEQIDKGIYLEKPVERVYFGDMRTFLECITSKRFALMDTLHKSGAMSINALAKLLGRNYKNVHDDVKTLEQIRLLEKNDKGLYLVPWDEITITAKLAV